MESRASAISVAWQNFKDSNVMKASQKYETSAMTKKWEKMADRFRAQLEDLNVFKDDTRFIAWVRNGYPPEDVDYIAQVSPLVMKARRLFTPEIIAFFQSNSDDAMMQHAWRSAGRLLLALTKLVQRMDEVDRMDEGGMVFLMDV